MYVCNIHTLINAYKYTKVDKCKYIYIYIYMCICIYIIDIFI